MNTVVTVGFTQYMMPNGRKVPVSITLEGPIELESKVQSILDAGLSFGIEMLTTGQISMTIEDIANGMDADIRVCNNGPGVPEKVKELIMGFNLEEHLARIAAAA